MENKKGNQAATSKTQQGTTEFANELDTKAKKTNNASNTGTTGTNATNCR